MGAKETALAEALSALEEDVMSLDTTALEAAINTNGTRNMVSGTYILIAIKRLKEDITRELNDAEKYAIPANLS